jgi:hypothetical protein
VAVSLITGQPDCELFSNDFGVISLCALLLAGGYLFLRWARRDATDAMDHELTAAVDRANCMAAAPQG